MAVVWEAHWLKDYKEPRLVKHRGKWHWAVTKPKELQRRTDPDKKLSTGTTDEVVAEERKQEVVAKIYKSFDEARAKIDPQIKKNEEFLSRLMELLASHGHTDPRLKGLNNPFFAQDNIVRAVHALGITIPDDMIELISDEAKHWLKTLPYIGDKTEADTEAEKLFGKKDIDVMSTMKQMIEGAEYLNKNPNAPDRELIQGGLKELAKKFAQSTGGWATEADKDLAAKLQQTSSSISVVGKKYLEKKNWGKQRTKSGAKLAIERFCEVVGGETDINDVTAKDAYALAQWMQDDLGSANKSIKGAISYVKGMFSWAITQKEYTITEEPWGTLNRIGDYGTPEESYKPLRKE